MHYARLRKDGVVGDAAHKPRQPKATLEEATKLFWAKVDKGETCWTWTASKDQKGYGRFRFLGKTRYSHRWSYEQEFGEVPPGFQLDHMCRNKACVRPSHLRQVTNKQNNEHRAGPQKNNSSGALGVYWHKRIEKWQVSVGHNGKQIHIGYFEDIEDAKKAAVAKRLELFTHNDLDRMG